MRNTANHFKTLKPKLFEKRLNAAWSFDGKSWTEVRFRRIPTSSKQSLVSVARFFGRRVECCECSIGVLRCRSPFSSHWRSRLKGESPKEQSYYRTYTSLESPLRLLLGPVEAILKVRWLVGKKETTDCSQRLLCPWTCSWPHNWWDHLRIYSKWKFMICVIDLTFFLWRDLNSIVLCNRNGPLYRNA